jgi:diguanylate cyclase (GGDEF)-like protein/PAS domain S-box-containing protein
VFAPLQCFMLLHMEVEIQGNPIDDMENRCLNVLLIENNHGYADMMRIVLSKVRGAQFNLECVNQLSHGLECLSEGSIDVVLLDLSLPDSKGLDTFFKVFDQAPGVPIIVLTATDDDTLAVKAVQAGAQDYLVKGQVDGNLLVRSIHYAIERHRIQEELRRQTALKLQSSEARFRNVLEKNADGIVIVNKKGLVLFVNPAAEAMFDRRSEDLLGKSFGYPVVAGEATELEIVRSGGASIAAEMCVVETEWENDVVYLASLRDITERKRMEEALRESEDKYRTIFETTGTATIIIEQDSTVSIANTEFEKLFGYSKEEIEGKRKWTEFVFKDDLEKVRQYYHLLKIDPSRAPRNYECKFMDRKGTIKDIFVTVSMIPVTEKSVASLLDITERKKAEETIKELAYIDALTNLPNRLLFNDHLNLALAQAHRNKKKLGIMLLDLDRFKDINDTLGHNVGDLLLQNVGGRLRAVLRKSDTVARMGGDEFLLLLPEIAWNEDVAKVARKILDAFREPFLLDSHELRITASIGVAIYPENGKDAGTLLKNADIAMYSVKEHGRNNYRQYSSSLNPKALK